MTGPMQRIFRRRDSGSSRRSVAGLLRRPGGLFRRGSGGAKRLPWGRSAAAPPASEAVQTGVVEPPAGKASFRDRGRLRRRLRFLRRARELAFRDIGGLLFDMRRFNRERPDLLEAKIGALTAVDQELRALERILDDRRPIHELREPGISACARCGALHSSEASFCPNCGLQLGGPRAMGEVGGAIAAPPQPPPSPRPPAAPAPAPAEQPTAATMTAPPQPESPQTSQPTERLLPPDEAA
jgi:ribosomal protein L40E